MQDVISVLAKAYSFEPAVTTGKQEEKLAELERKMEQTQGWKMVVSLGDEEEVYYGGEKGKKERKKRVQQKRRAMILIYAYLLREDVGTALQQGWYFVFWKSFFTY